MNVYHKLTAVTLIAVCMASLTGCMTCKSPLSASYTISPAGIKRFSDVSGRIDQIEEALLAGYAALVDDLENGRLSAVNEETLRRYASSAIDMRTIGFPNWITELRGNLLLNQVKELDLRIKLMEARGASGVEIGRLVDGLRGLNDKLEKMAVEEQVE